MGQGRGNAVNRTLALGLAILVVMAMAQPTLAAVYYVGGSSGWSYTSSSWAKGKYFKAGDYLVFRYNKSYHNVVAVSGTGYNYCSTPTGSRYYQTGNDYIKLVRGTNNFICSFRGHCGSGMKLSVKAY